MHPFHDYVARQVGEKLKERQIIVWYDPRQEFVSFINEVRGGQGTNGQVAPVTVSGLDAHLVEYAGSYFELRAAVEPLIAGDKAENTIVYIPGEDRDEIGSVLMELEKAGTLYQPKLHNLARYALRQRYTDGIIDELLNRKGVTYQDLAHAASEAESNEPPSVLKAIYSELSGNDKIVAEWIVHEGRDGDIVAKDAIEELVKLIRSRLSLDLPSGSDPAKLRAITQRYILANEFRSDLTCPAPTSLEGIAAAVSKSDLSAVRDLACMLRDCYPDEYESIADRIESELGLQNALIPVGALGSIDTFRFEERALLGHCGDFITSSEYAKALELVNEREQSFWLDRDIVRKSQWEACRRMAELGVVAVSVQAALPATTSTSDAWVDAYTAKDGWYLLDRAQRRLESWIASLDDDPEERALVTVRHAYEDTCHLMAQGFAKALEKSNWAIGSTMAQTSIYSDILLQRPKPVAYFLVDAMRFEMGAELSERLPETAEVALRPAIGVLPSITPIGMAALLPGASGSFSVVEEKGKLGARIDETFLSDLNARRKFLESRVPEMVDLVLDDLLGMSPSKLAKKLDKAQFVLVRSQEIDSAGEGGFTRQARRIMDEVIADIARAVRKLAAAGIENAVISADHGHLFFATERDESMRIDKPGGNEVDLHRRCWVGRGGATPPGCIRVPASALGYASDLDFIFPAGAGVFKAGGDLAFHHGGPSLQEMVVPVLTVRLKVQKATPVTASPLTVVDAPEMITTRIIRVELRLGGAVQSMFTSTVQVRPVLISGGREVGAVEMAIGAELDRDKGLVELQSDKLATLGFKLSDDEVKSLRIVIQDPKTDAELYRSPQDIPVSLSI